MTSARGVSDPMPTFFLNVSESDFPHLISLNFFNLLNHKDMQIRH